MSDCHPLFPSILPNTLPTSPAPPPPDPVLLSALLPVFDLNNIVDENIPVFIPGSTDPPLLTCPAPPPLPPLDPLLLLPPPPPHLTSILFV